jgi:RNA polymerase II subunit A small phosphatase-like protein
MLGRDLSEVIIIDNSPACYIFQPNNAIPITSWFDDFEDDELMELVPFLRELKECKDVSLVLDSSL